MDQSSLGNNGIPLKSLILAAGLGTRLRPLTDVIPKPLAPVCNVPLFDAAVRRCVLAGSTDVAINVHHLADVMTDHANRNFLSLGAQALHVSKEFPEVLGTGGALVQISDWWGRSPLLVYNGDILSDMPLNDLVARHNAAKPLVTMAVRKVPPTDGGRSVWVNSAGKVVLIAKRSDLPGNIDPKELTEYGFACSYVTESNLKEYLPSKPMFFDIIEGFNAAIFAGKTINAVCYDGFWADVGNPKSLWETNLRVAAMPQNQRVNLLGVDGLRPIQSTAKNIFGDEWSVVSHQTAIQDRTSFRNSVILGGEVICSGESLENTIRGFGLNIKFK